MTNLDYLDECESQKSDDDPKSITMALHDDIIKKWSDGPKGEAKCTGLENIKASLHLQCSQDFFENEELAAIVNFLGKGLVIQSNF